MLGMSQISSIDDKTVVELEAGRLWELQQDLRKIRATYPWSGEGIGELRDEFDLLATMSGCPAIVHQSRMAVSEIDRYWPKAAVA